MHPKTCFNLEKTHQLMRDNLMTLPQLYRSDRTSLVRIQIKNYRLVVLFMIKMCILFVCYDCIGYFSRFAYTLTHIACFHKSVNIQIVLQIVWLQFVIIIIAALTRSNLTIDDDRLDSNCLQIYLYQTVDLFACYTIFIKLIGLTLYIDYVPFSR